MAITDKQAIMVVHQEGMSTSTSAPQTTSACSLFVVLKELQPGSGMQEEGHMLVNREASFAEKSTAGTGVALSLPLSAMAAANTSNHLPAETTCKGITVTLDNNNMWNEFYRCQTEMILTKQGRRMFPYCRFRISGLEPFQSYTLAMDMHPADNYRYKWCDRRWETNGKADPHIIRSFIHPESPSTGFDWMQNPISFYKLKLTNNPMDQEGHIIINSMHRYLPRLHIIPADKATDVVQLNGPDVITFSFPQTEFFAVTAYQNLSITQLKIDYNPFAKGFRDDANSPRAGKPKNGLSTEAVDGEPKLSREATTLNNLKTLFAKRNAAGKVLKGETNSVSTNGDIKKVNGDTPLATESEKSSSKKRQWPGGLSELIKGAHVKVKRMSLEDFQHKSTFYLPPGETLDATYKDPKPESLSGSEVEKERKPKKQTVNTDFVSESEGHITANTVSSVKVSEPFIVKHETEESPETINVECSLASESVSDVSGKEKVDTTLKKTTGLPDDLGNSKKSQSMVKSSDSGEVKKKRAEPVPLPLLAHFLQQLKSKTRAKAKPEAFSVSSPSDKSSDTTSVTESSLPSTSSTPSNTSSNAQPPSSVIPEPISVFSDASSSSLSTTLSSTLLTSSLVALPDASVPLSPSSSPLVQVPDPALISKHNTALTPDSVCDTVSDSTADATPLSMPQDVPVTSPSFSNSAVPTSCLSGSTLDTNVSTVLPSGAPDDAPCSADAQDNNHVHSEVTTTTESTPNPIMDSSTPPCPDLLPENLPQSPLSDDGMNMMFSPSHTPSSPDCSMPSPATSSPDPFPPDLFSNRPIPPRKTLDPFSPYVSFDELKPPSDTPHAVSKCLFSTRQTFTGGSESAVANINCTVASPVLDSQPCSPKATNQCLQESAIKKSKVKHRKSGKSKLNEDQEVTEGPIPVPMQPNLEDVEGQLFVSFVSKKALEVHLGDEEVSQETEKNVENEVSYSIEERIDELEKVLLRDLKMMKHRQVIHPVLQEVGLKLNLLDLTLAIDLQYLGVCLPIPPPVVLPGESSSSSQGVLFVSRTGKTTDFTKIKGWREKFVSSNSSTNSAVNTTADSGQKNLSAFCSDMLDEYLENEGKLIDERAANLSQTSVSPVVYQLPTKSTSYVRTLDSVLKKQISPTIESPIKSFPPSKKSAATSKRKQVSKSGENALKKSSKSAKMSSSLKMPSATSNNEAPKVGETLSKKSKSGKIKTKKCSKTSEAAPLATGRLAVSSSSGPTGTQGSASISPGSNTTALRSPGLPKTLVKLMDVEDGAVWEGKHRTCITEERATIALCALFTTEGALRAVPSTIIKRRAPPCLNDFCRLGCVCASLAQERRQHHCGKPQCMLGCNCLRRKVVLLKKSAEYEDRNEGPEADVCSSENESSAKRSKKKKMAYIISGPEAAPEPATHVKTLWDRQGSDPECLFTPNPSRPNCPPLLYPDLQQDLENFLHPSPKRVKHGASSGAMKEKPSKMTCARVRPFSRRKHVEQSDVMEHHVSSHDSFQEMEEGELRPPTLSGPFKRLEIVSKCTWDTEGSRNVVLRVVCERMAQDRLKNPFWIGKYRIEPTSRTVHETEEGTTITYKVVISQSRVVDTKKEEDERLKHLEAQLIKTIGKSEVKGLPLLSKVASAGFLKAEKKPPGAQGQITVNGKPYPQAKLELGWMGALHPANRLAAYITGRICPSNQQATKPVTSSTSITKTSSTVSTTAITSWATTTTTTTTTTVTNTNPSYVTISVKPTVTKPPVGTGFTPVVINHVDSQQQNLRMTSVPRLQGTIKNIIHSTSSLTGATGVSLSPKTPPKSSMASTDGCIKVVKTLPKSGSTLSENPAKMLTVPGPRAASPGVGASLMQPGACVRPAGPGQKMVFQVLKTTKGNTLYRNPNGQIIQLVPLSHLKALNPKFVISKQTTLVRLPSPSSASPSKPQNSSHSIVICPSSLAKSTTKAHITSAHSAPAVSVTTAVTSSVVNSAASLSGFKPFLTSSQPSTVKIIPSFPSDSCTTNLTTIPQAAVDPRNAITTSVSLDSASSDVTSPNKDLVLPPPQSCVPTQSQDKSDSTAHFRSASDTGSQQDEQSLQLLNENSETTVPLDHSYTSESKTKCKEHNNEIESANVPEHMEEVLDLGPIETDEELSEMDAVLDVEEGAVEVEIDSDCTELTEDSDMYDDSNSEHSDQEDLCIDADSDDGEKKKTREISTTKRQDLCEKDDEVVDIESYEERSGKSTASQELKQQESIYQTPVDTDESEEEEEEEEDEDLIRYKKNTMEKERRSSLKAQFHKLHLALENDKHRMSNLKLLIQAQKEIQLLITQSDQLMKTEDKLRKKRAFFLQLASQLTGKTEESISQKLDEIITKQKALEAQIKTKNPPSHFTEPDSGTKSKEHSPKPINLKKVDDPATSPVHLSPNSKPIDLSVPKRKILAVQHKEMRNVPRPKQPVPTLNMKAPPVSRTTQKLGSHSPPSLASRERTRPNILSRSKSQSLPESSAAEQILLPQVIPVLEAVLPCNQIFTLHNSLQAGGITSLVERQSVTPGVASVSISVPAVSHPMRVENPITILQPQNCNVSTQVTTVSIPKISSVVSLVPTEKLLVPPPMVLQKVDSPAVVQTQLACNLVAGKTQQNPSPDQKVLNKPLSEVMCKQLQQGAQGNVTDGTSNQNQEGTGVASNSEQDDENLMSLLDELVFLNQQLTNESSQPQEGDLNLINSENVPSDLLTENKEGVDKDDERSLSPLFLRLDEDLIASTTSKDDLDDIPPKLDDLVNVIFGSDSPPNSSESEVVAAADSDITRALPCDVVRDAPSPPPLMQMKTGGGDTAQPSKEQATLSWRPMPKLAPLGLKTQEAGQPKGTSPQALKPSSKLPSFHSANI